MRLRGLLFLLALAAAPAQSAAPQGAPVATIKTQVRRVLVDVVVTNNKGEAVTGLRQADFEVLEDGKPQAIASFEEHHGAATQPVAVPRMPANVYTNFPVMQTTDSVNVLLLDALNTPASDQVFVRSEMIKYLTTIPAGTRVAIFTLASQLRMLQGMTTDSSVLLAVLKNPKAWPQPSLLLRSDVEKDADQRRIDFMVQEQQGPVPQDPAAALNTPDPINAAREFLHDTDTFQAEERIGLTLQALEQLGRYLSGIPGRKNVIWFSGAFPDGILPDSDLTDPFKGIHSFQDQVRRTTDLLATAQVAIYPVAAEGLVSDSQFQTNNREISQRRAARQAQDEIHAMRNEEADRNSAHGVMETLAQNTGGKAFYNTNGLGDALARVVNNGTRYYSLTYAPSNGTMDGKFRRIQVKLTGAKGALEYRRGYYAEEDKAGPASPKADFDPLLALMGRNLPDYSQILFKVLVVPVDPQPAPDAKRAGSNPDLKGPFTRYRVDFAISVPDLKIDLGPDGTHRGNIEVALVAYDREGKPLNFAVTKGDLLLQPKVYADMQKVGLQMRKEIDVPKEYVFLRSGVYDFRAGTAGTLGVPLSDAVAK